MRRSAHAICDHKGLTFLLRAFPCTVSTLYDLIHLLQHHHVPWSRPPCVFSSVHTHLVARRPVVS